MKTFACELLDHRGGEHFEARQFIAADASGSFGLLAGHAPLVAVLRYGLARFEDAGGSWHYLALPGGVLRFAGNRLSLATVRYFLGAERASLCEALAAEMARADSDVAAARVTLAKIEHSLLHRLSELGEAGMLAGGAR